MLPFSSRHPYPSDAWHRTRRTLFRTFRAKKFAALQQKRVVFDHYRCIFVHIPKCAGISVEKSLFGDFNVGHTSLKRYQIMFAPEEFRRYFKFTFVRNPFDRLVSSYFFMQKGGINEKDKRWAQRKLSGYENFEAFVKNWVTPFNVERALHFRPQTRFICLGDRPPALDFVGYLENIEADFAFVAQKIGLEAKLIETNRNAAREKDYRPYYTDETRNIVARVYADDLRILGYTFDNADLKTRLARRGPDGRLSA
jgi:Sulfotransferase family